MELPLHYHEMYWRNWDQEGIIYAVTAGEKIRLYRVNDDGSYQVYYQRAWRYLKHVPKTENGAPIYDLFDTIQDAEKSLTEISSYLGRDNKSKVDYENSWKFETKNARYHIRQEFGMFFYCFRFTNRMEFLYRDKFDKPVYAIIEGKHAPFADRFLSIEEALAACQKYGD